MRLAEQIKDALDLRETMEHYGIRFNRHGYAICPFHSEKTASLSVKNNRFKCFGCGKSGDVISFVMMYFNLCFGQSLVRLNSDFRLGLTAEKPTEESRARARARQEEHRKIQEKRALERAFYNLVIDHHRRLFQAGADEARLLQVEKWLDENIEMGGGLGEFKRREKQYRLYERSLL
ncbi:MAG: CHC2 zinc finger domain-containing protein [Eubacteriales bacterium]|nr:CHC2 zinc finger domain-containing protein [Eubacteriales bacterium]